jgi:hypothetical protein
MVRENEEADELLALHDDELKLAAFTSSQKTSHESHLLGEPWGVLTKCAFDFI